MKGLFVIGIILSFTACKKETEENHLPTNSSSTVNYTPMTIGSYWIYDWYVIDSAGNSTPYGISDSVFIVGDTIISGSTFSIQSGTWYGVPKPSRFLRDSVGYLVDETGSIFFSEGNYTDTLYIWNSGDGSETGCLKMNDIGTVVTVTAGTFSTLNAQYTVVNNIGTWPCLGTLDIHNNRYAINVGEVSSTFQFTGDITCKIFERRLRTYYIN